MNLLKQEKSSKITIMKIYRRGVLYALHRLDRYPYHSSCNLANDYVHRLCGLPISQEANQEGSKLCVALSPLSIRLTNDFEKYE